MTLEFDLVLTGGRLIDPATNTDANRDIGIRAGKIAAVADHLPSEKAKTWCCQSKANQPPKSSTISLSCRDLTPFS